MRLISTISFFIAVLIGSANGKLTREYIIFETYVHDSLNIGVYGTGHVQRFRDSLTQNISLMVTLEKKEQYSGLYMALKNPLNLSETRNKYLSFRIKGAQGNENIYVYLSDTSKDSGDYNLQVGKKIADISTITKEWEEIYIPLDSFPVKGENWNHRSSTDSLPITGTFDWTEVNSISFSKPDTIGYTFFLDDIKIVAREEPEY